MKPSKTIAPSSSSLPLEKEGCRGGGGGVALFCGWALSSSWLPSSSVLGGRGGGGGKSVGRQARREIAGKQPHPSTFLQPFLLREGLFCTTYCSNNNNSKMEASVGTCEHLNGPLFSPSLLFEPFLCSDDDDDTYLTPPKRKEEEKRLPRGRGRMGSHASFLLLLSKERRRQFATGEGSEETISEARSLERPFSSSEKVCSPWVSFFFFFGRQKKSHLHRQ